MKLKIILKMSIIVVFVKNHEIQIISPTTVHILNFQLIPIAFLRNIHLSSLGGLISLTRMNIALLLLTRARVSILHVINVVILAVVGLLNLSNVILIFTLGA